MTYTTLKIIVLISILLVFNCKESTSKATKNGIQIATESDVVVFKDFFEDGSLKVTGQYTNNEKTGEWIWYMSNEKVLRTENYEHNKLEGNLRLYYPNGQLRTEGQHSNNNQVGTWNKYTENGILKYVEIYDSIGKATGEWKTYYDTGEIIHEENYLNGLPNGTWKTYNKKGNLMSYGEKIAGKKEGIWKYYDENKKLIRTIIYEKDIKLSKK
ncbi:toxin-antitoxin system YwqK family antitoxin [Cellulophaga baltica]|uniref:toxin-antitoxin system YwqK family antitoxin n=1 Tax=Cellulophaga TaxID=104264 RepID=UPI001C069D27|nr:MULTISPECIES: toxin-antitoxin system YwqK family antitoxin [Cellulophaga]MBU2995887.1 toxin-antitoxin system YwqK family antitoxin [Cellulophaga baltica]MDO6767282.1 toxin-antitoxin system YwqK family antitoxin [Cellulophaga sp. 1_MG-2023]